MAKYEKRHFPICNLLPNLFDEEKPGGGGAIWTLATPGDSLLSLVSDFNGCYYGPFS